MNKKDSYYNHYRSLILGIALIALLVIYIVSALVRDPKEPEARMISVILYDAGTSGWEALAEGMESARADYNVELNVIVMREDANAEEQMNIVQREIDGGADGLILSVTDHEAMYRKWLEQEMSIPVLTVESGFGVDNIPNVAADDYGMGYLLGEAILKNNDEQEKLNVAVTDNTYNRVSLQERKKGLADALSDRGEVRDISTGSGLFNADAVVALDKTAAMQLLESGRIAGYGSRFYVIGNTPMTVAALGHDEIREMVFQNEFNIGYMAVSGIDDILQGRDPGDVNIEYYLIDRDDIYDSKYEHLLFPIVE